MHLIDDSTAQTKRVVVDHHRESLSNGLRRPTRSRSEVFGGLSGMRPGFATLCRQLGRRERDLELTRYAVCLLFLERKLMRNQRMREEVLKGIRNARGQVEFFCLTHEAVLARLADVYTSTISKLSPRIMVTGTPQFLNNPRNANKIRALLLAGLRATVLWRQVGGNRFQLLFSRARALQSAQQILAQLKA